MTRREATNDTAWESWFDEAEDLEETPFGVTDAEDIGDEPASRPLSRATLIVGAVALILAIISLVLA